MNSACPFEDWLQSAGIPEDEGLYFVGTFDRRITFYSQQVRALQLIHALKMTGRLSESHDVAIVGAGAAGVTAAVATALVGANAFLFDTAQTVLQLQSSSPRMLHPHIYEWPKIGSLESHANLPILTWEATTGKKVQEDLQKYFDAANSKLDNLIFTPQNRLKCVTRSGTSKWELEFLDSQGKEDQRLFKHVILAIGFGDEISCGVSKNHNYWKHNSTGATAAEKHSPAHYFVSGNGDGGLTDFINLVVSNYEHLSFTKTFLSYFDDETLQQETAKAYAQSQAEYDLEQAFETYLTPLLSNHNVLTKLQPRLRTDREITINSNGPLFVAGKAAQLNQVIAFSVLAAAKEKKLKIIRSSGKVDDVCSENDKFKVLGPQVDEQALTQSYDRVYLRHGPDRAGCYKPVEQYFERYEAHVTDHGRCDEIPALGEETFEFFKTLEIDNLKDPASKISEKERLARAHSTIVIGQDLATHQLFEQGRERVLGLAQRCDQLTEDVHLVVTIPPDQVSDRLNIIRMIKASHERIKLYAVEAVYEQWREQHNATTLHNDVFCYFPAQPLDTSGLSGAIDQCLLRLLNGRITDVLQNSNWTALGKIDPSIIAQISPIWTSWNNALQTDLQLRSSFLRWLNSVDLHQSPWEGDRERIGDFVDALLLMLGTSLGQNLTPIDDKEYGNLAFNQSSRALGSGCRTIGKLQLADSYLPDDWTADALILSGTSELARPDEHGKIQDGGMAFDTLESPQRVHPVTILNNLMWRKKLQQDVKEWTLAIEREFKKYHERQDNALKEVSR
ncbi:ABC-three component system protein [Thalassospira sp.]|uniref:ABC-three component system protein n=1 Tax=Thalassospira sp. TaxID=1912094 RepID=UPI0032EF0F4A